MTIRILKWEQPIEGGSVVVTYDAGTGDQPQVTVPAKVFFNPDTTALQGMLELACKQHQALTNLNNAPPLPGE